MSQPKSLLGGVRLYLLERDDIRLLFTNVTAGDKISPSRQKPLTPFPWIELSHVGSNPELMSDRFIIDTEDRIRLGLYAISYPDCFNIGREINLYLLQAINRIKFDVFDGSDYIECTCTLQTAMKSYPVPQPPVEGLTGEVWKWDLDYKAVTGFSL